MLFHDPTESYSGRYNYRNVSVSLGLELLVGPSIFTIIGHRVARSRASSVCAPAVNLSGFKTFRAEDDELTRWALCSKSHGEEECAPLPHTFEEVSRLYPSVPARNRRIAQA